MDTAVHAIVLGLVYGVLAAGLVLVYRTSRVVNFAHGQTGALGAAVLAKLVLDEHWPGLAALPAVLCVGGAIGALTQIVVARPLRDRPRLVLLVATIGLTQMLLVAQLLIPDINEIAPYPSLIHRQVAFGSVQATGRDFLVLALVPAIVVVLTLWLLRTPSGRALRAIGDDRDAAELAGVRTARVELAAWAVAGVVATAAAVLVNPLQGVIVGRPTESLGAGLMVRALAAALVGRLRSVPLALAGGIGVGLLQAVANGGGVDPAIADVLMLAFVLAAVFTVARGEPGDRESLVAVPPPRRLSASIWGPALVAAIGAAAAPIVVTRSQLFSLSRIALYAIVGLSLVVLTGWAGQLSLGQFALVGAGTFTAALLERNGMPFVLTIPAAAAVGATVSLVIGVPALRVRGLELAVTTLAFAVACGSWVFTRHRLLDRGGLATVTRAELVREPRAYYELCLCALVVVTVGAMAIRRGDLGRRLLAVRGNEARAATLGVSPVVTKLTAFAIAGALAASSGALLGALRIRSAPSDFGPDESLRIVAVTVIGGAGGVVGAVIGAVFVLGVPAVFGDTTVAGLLPSGLGLLVLALLFPGGLAELTRRVVGRAAGTERGVGDGAGDGVAAPGAPASLLAPTSAIVPRSPPAALAVRHLTVLFGGRVALDGISLEILAGTIVGLIGPNGAGKTTLLDVVSGFVTPSEGEVVVAGEALSGTSPAARARAGIGRVLQDARLFDDLTVGEIVALAARGTDRGAEAIEALALGPVADIPSQNLPGALRRRVELACVVARRPRLLLLDEPTAGLGGAESAAFAPLLADIHALLGCTVVIVEHDTPLVAAVAGRLVCLAAGSIIADGSPADVLAHPEVAVGYLGAG